MAVVGVDVDRSDSEKQVEIGRKSGTRSGRGRGSMIIMANRPVVPDDCCCCSFVVVGIVGVGVVVVFVVRNG